MFWTIVGAILFVTVGIPIIIGLIGLAISLIGAIFSRDETYTPKVLPEQTSMEQEEKTKKTRRLILIGGLVVIVLAVVGVSLDDSANNTADYSSNIAPANSYVPKQNVVADQQTLDEKYATYIDKMISDHNGMIINSFYETEIIKNTPYGLSYAVVKQKLLAMGYTFAEYYEKSALEEQEDNKITTIVKDLETKYPDKTINSNEEFDIRRNLPSTISYSTIKDAMLEKGFEFIGYEPESYNIP